MKGAMEAPGTRNGGRDLRMGCCTREIAALQELRVFETEFLNLRGQHLTRYNNFRIRSMIELVDDGVATGVMRV
jgi:hypothetical protein